MKNLIDLQYSDKSASENGGDERKKCCAGQVWHGSRVRYSCMTSGVNSLYDAWKWP